MSSFYVEVIGAEKFQNAEQMLADVPGGMERALKSATKRAVSFLSLIHISEPTRP